MPELPEVETIRKQMEAELPGSIIASVDVRDRHCFVGNENTLVGETITEVKRVGKYLFVSFASGRGLAIHLKMTGRLVTPIYDSRFMIHEKIDYETAEHTRVVIMLADGRKIYYWDTRMFGYIQVCDNFQATISNLQMKLGKEPWKITEIEFLRKLQKTNRAIKNVLLDQTILAGVGNIYANDALWVAGILPQRLASSISLTEVRKLLTALHTTMERSLVLGGASDNTYRDFYGNRGGYQNEFLVYGGGMCKRCNGQLTYGKIGGRGSWWCERCQA